MYIKKRYLNYLIRGVTLFFCLVLFKVFIADIYYIPTGSMKNTIEAKSFAIASKIHYGAILPRTTHEIPYLSRVFKKFDPLKLWRNSRIHGFCSIKNRDIILTTYKKIKLAKRVIGTPGDTVTIKNGVASINHQEEEILDSYRYKYTGEFTKEEIENLKRKTEIVFLGNNQYDIILNGKILKTLKNKRMTAQSLNKEIVVSKNKNTIFPEIMDNVWDKNNYGPIIVPFIGMKIELNQKNYYIYKDIISTYENIKIQEDNCKYLIDEKEALSYIFKKDYFFLLGDNRMESNDSRYIGFLPMNNIFAKVIFWF